MSIIAVLIALSSTLFVAAHPWRELWNRLPGLGESLSDYRTRLAASPLWPDDRFALEDD